MLNVEQIHTYYGLSHILFDVSLKVKQGQVVCLLGRNGAGKTTTLKSIMGIAPPSKGCIKYQKEDVTAIEPYRLARKGIAWVPDDRRIFADLTVDENLEIAEKNSTQPNAWNKEKLYDLFPSLGNYRNRKGGLLSGGEQKMLAIARALNGNPEFILLDEPTEGLAPALINTLQKRIQTLKEAGLTVLLAEQNIKFTLGLSDYGYIIDNGRICYQGFVKDLIEDEEVRRTCGI